MALLTLWHLVEALSGAEGTRSNVTTGAKAGLASSGRVERVASRVSESDVRLNTSTMPMERQIPAECSQL